MNEFELTVICELVTTIIHFMLVVASTIYFDNPKLLILIIPILYIMRISKYYGFDIDDDEEIDTNRLLKENGFVFEKLDDKGNYYYTREMQTFTFYLMVNYKDKTYATWGIKPNDDNTFIVGGDQKLAEFIDILLNG